MTLSLDNITIGYGTKTVASGITATAVAGQLVCLAGANGTGKSTLMKTIARFLPTMGGTVTIGGRDTAAMSRTDMARCVAVVLTETPAAQHITAWETVALGRTPHTGFLGMLNSRDRLVVEQALHTAGAAHLAERSMATLSDGERQKVMIAKALAQETPLILLDEPTAFLDFQSKVELMHTLRQLAHEQHKVVIISTHDLHIALDIADSVWITNNKTLTTHKPPLDHATIRAFAGDIAARYLCPPPRG